MNQTVTVAICVRDGEKYLAEAISSAKQQTRAADEILVIDDGSTDGSAQIALEQGCRVISQGPLGLGTARNRAFAEALGDYVYILDCDDLMTPTALKDLLAEIQKTPQAVGCFGARQNFISPELAGQTQLKNQEFLLPESGGLPCGSLWRKSLASKISFNLQLRTCDVDWIDRHNEAGSIFARTDSLVMKRRIHQSNMSLDPKIRQEYLAIAKAKLIRLRGLGEN